MMTPGTLSQSWRFLVFGTVVMTSVAVAGEPRGPKPKSQSSTGELEQRVALLEKAVQMLCEERVNTTSDPRCAQMLASLAETASEGTDVPGERSQAADAAHIPSVVPPMTSGLREAESALRSAKSTADDPVRREMPPELIPEIGKVGAEVGLLVGGSSNPFALSNGMYAGGFIDLPLFDRPSWLHGKVSYEILVGMSQSQTTLKSTSNVAQVANLVVLDTLNPNGGLNNVVAAVSGTGPAPFPVTTTNVTRLRLLQVVPFAFKYTTTRFDRWRFRPYGVLGFGTYVTIHNQNPGRGPTPTNGVRSDANLPSAVLADVTTLFGGKAPFGGPLVAGQISQSPELEARGLPGGHGNMDFGLHVGGGFEYRVSPLVSVGFDARFNKVTGSNGGFTTFAPRVAFHF